MSPPLWHKYNYFIKVCMCVLLLEVVVIIVFSYGNQLERKSILALVTRLPWAEYERMVQQDENSTRPALGKDGLPAYLTGMEKMLGEASNRKVGLNLILSNRIPYDREIRDLRDPLCGGVEYSGRLPAASVVIIFCEEPLSALLRTVHSVLRTTARVPLNSTHLRDMDNSTFAHLREIVLVDDHSTHNELHRKLDHYIGTRLPPGLVWVLRLPQRSGLMRARMAGAGAARGEALVFLDAHCETSRGWLPPLLHYLRDHPASAAVPVLDFIDPWDFYYHKTETIWVGGFSFDGYFNWNTGIPPRVQRLRNSSISPIPCPSMPGGVFSMLRRRFWELGGYDDQMESWGGEDLEMSFKTWMCGGSIEVIPCARIGHVTRIYKPYNFTAEAADRNIARMAEVWMDDYKEVLYMYKPHLRNVVADVSMRRALRARLQCRSFGWFLRHVCPELTVPIRDTEVFGKFRNEHVGLCLTVEAPNPVAYLMAQPCDLYGQFFALTIQGAFREFELCAMVPLPINERKNVEKNTMLVQLDPCGDHEPKPGQSWDFLSSGQLRHSGSGLCLEAGPRPARALLRPCAPTHSQRWLPDYNIRSPDSTLPPNPEMKAAYMRIRQDAELSETPTRL